jgi:hypothetical protein
MSNLVAAEFLKMRTTRTFWWVTALGLALTVLVIVITLATQRPWRTPSAASRWASSARRSFWASRRRGFRLTGTRLAR